MQNCLHSYKDQASVGRSEMLQTMKVSLNPSCLLRQANSARNYFFFPGNTASSGLFTLWMFLVLWPTNEEVPSIMELISQVVT